MFDRGRVAKLDALTRAAGLVGALICAAAPLFTQLTLDLAGAELPVFCFVAMGAIAVVYGRWRGAPKLAAAAAMTADLIGFALVLGTLSYIGAAMNRPSMAQAFAAADRALGFDWPLYAAIVRSQPWLGWILWAAYSTMIPQLGALVLLFAATGRQALLRFLVDGFILMALLAIFIAWLMPAVDADVHFGALAVAKTEAGWSTPLLRVEHFLNLRDGFMTRIPVMDSTGIVTFPSFHTMCGVLFAACFAQVRWLKWPALAVNALMIAATPVEGGHYLVDVLAGIGLSAAVLWAMAAFLKAEPAQAQPALAPA
jgi:membrane-associated phospholipid phosphatase